jgi:hypothetical protein
MVAKECLGRCQLFRRLKNGPHRQLVERYAVRLVKDGCRATIKVRQRRQRDVAACREDAAAAAGDRISQPRDRRRMLRPSAKGREPGRDRASTRGYLARLYMVSAGVPPSDVTGLRVFISSAEIDLMMRF